MRALRIVPALAAETILSALILGPLITTVSLQSYFTNPALWKYLLNIGGLIHYYLPGLFLSNPLPAMVNGQLWTVPFELQCYLLLFILALSGVIARPKLLLGSAIAMQVALFLVRVQATHGHFDELRRVAMTGYGLVMMFISGVIMYTWRRSIPHSRGLFFAAVIATVFGLSVPLGDYVIAFPAAYVTAYVGLLNPRAGILHRLGDLSYGIFLYGFPIQQMIASWGLWSHRWYLNIVFALPITIVVALVSWNVVERPTLELKRHLGFLRPVDAALRRLLVPSAEVKTTV